MSPYSRPRAVAVVTAAAALIGIAGAVPATGGKPPSSPSTVSFAGRTWQIKAAPRQMGPGPNLFSASNVRVDPGGSLHLGITRSGRSWSCAEVILDRSLGYGTYEWTIQGAVDRLDPNVVLGLFTWEDSSSLAGNREIDVEVARWGNAADPTNAQYVVQPYDRPGNLQRLTVPPATSVTVRFTWSPGQVVASGTAQTASGAVALPTWTSPSVDVPTPLGERVHMNLWLYGGRAPSNGQPVDVVLSGFTFTPLQ